MIKKVVTFVKKWIVILLSFSLVFLYGCEKTVTTEDLSQLDGTCEIKQQTNSESSELNCDIYNGLDFSLDEIVIELDLSFNDGSQPITRKYLMWPKYGYTDFYGMQNTNTTTELEYNYDSIEDFEWIFAGATAAKK